MTATCLTAVLLYSGCAGELEQSPESFKCAYTDTAATTDACQTVGGSANGGSANGGSGNGGTNGGSATTGGAPVIPPDDACVASALSDNTCLSCHSTASANLIGAGLDLSGANLGAKLAVTKATYKNAANPTACVPGNLIIDPANPSNSLLLKKIMKTQECGTEMPPGGQVSADALACLQGWIAKFKP
jgi:hypothetical protein